MLSTHEQAALLHRYMRFRADFEGQAYELTPKFFFACLRAGIRHFFGVYVNTVSGIVHDVQNPAALREWQLRKSP